MATTNKTVLNIGISGGGIAGFSAAIALRDAGHEVEVFERSSFANEAGAAVSMQPNPSRILASWNFDVKRARAVQMPLMEFIRSNGTDRLALAPMTHLEEQYGAPWYSYHRVDLHAELQRQALTRGAKLRLATAVEDVDCATGTITLAGGEKVVKDLVVAADGVHSKTTLAVTGDPTRATPTGQAVFRALIPTQKLVDAGLSEVMLLDKPGAGRHASDPERILVWYSCRNNEVVNLGGIHPVRDGRDAQLEDWHFASSVEEFLDEYKDFAPQLKDIIRQADTVKYWPLLFRKPITNWYKGKVVLAGDAAHPMLPHRGQGAAQAVEDALALGLACSNMRSADDLPSRLAMYQQIRKNRAAAMQIFSNSQPSYRQDASNEEMVKPFYKDPYPQTQLEFNHFNWDHDVRKESVNVLRANGIEV